MNATQGSKTPAAAVGRLRWQVFGLLAGSWLLSAAILFVLTQQSRAQQLHDASVQELSRRATIVYGLSYIDEAGQLRDELLRHEPGLEADGFVLRVLSLDFDAAPLRGAALDTDLKAALRVPHEQVAHAQIEAWSGEVGDRQVEILPLFGEEGDQPRAVICMTRPRAELVAEIASYTARLALAFSLASALGLGLAAATTRLVLRPVQRAELARETLLSGAAHELRTPLASLRAIIDSAEAGDESHERALARASDIVDAAALDVDALLAQARLSSDLEAPDLRATRIDLLIDSLLEKFPEAERELEENIAEVDVDAFRLAVSNLLENARRHGGAAEGRGMRVFCRAGEFVVEDSGPGFAAAMGERPRPELNRSYSAGGHGIGLSLARCVAELHGGEIGLERRETGSLVRMTWRA